jgi:hypothetical protein
MGCIGSKNNRVHGVKSWNSFESEEALNDRKAKKASKSEIDGQESNPPTGRSKNAKIGSPKPGLGRSNSPRTGSPQVGNPRLQFSPLIEPNEPTTYYNDSPEENTMILKQTFTKYDRDGANSLAEGELKSVFKYLGWITNANYCAEMI